MLKFFFIFFFSSSLWALSNQVALEQFKLPANLEAQRMAVKYHTMDVVFFAQNYQFMVIDGTDMPSLRGQKYSRLQLKWSGQNLTLSLLTFEPEKKIRAVEAKNLTPENFVVDFRAAVYEVLTGKKLGGKDKNDFDKKSAERKKSLASKIEQANQDEEKKKLNSKKNADEETGKKGGGAGADGDEDGNDNSTKGQKGKKSIGSQKGQGRRSKKNQDEEIKEEATKTSNILSNEESEAEALAAQENFNRALQNAVVRYEFKFKLGTSLAYRSDDIETQNIITIANHLKYFGLGAFAQLFSGSQEKGFDVLTVKLYMWRPLNPGGYKLKALRDIDLGFAKTKALGPTTLGVLLETRQMNFIYLPQLREGILPDRQSLIFMTPYVDWPWSRGDWGARLQLSYGYLFYQASEFDMKLSGYKLESSLSLSFREKYALQFGLARLKVNGTSAVGSFDSQVKQATSSFVYNF